MSLVHAIVSPEQLGSTAEAALTAGPLLGLDLPGGSGLSLLQELPCQPADCQPGASLGAVMRLQRQAACCLPNSCHIPVSCTSVHQLLAKLDAPPSKSCGLCWTGAAQPSGALCVFWGCK